MLLKKQQVDKPLGKPRKQAVQRRQLKEQVVLHVAEVPEAVKRQQQDVHHEKPELVRSELRKKAVYKLFTEQEAFAEHTCHIPLLREESEEDQKPTDRETLVDKPETVLDTPVKSDVQLVSKLVANYKKFVDQQWKTLPGRLLVTPCSQQLVVAQME